MKKKKKKKEKEEDEEKEEEEEEKEEEDFQMEHTSAHFKESVALETVFPTPFLLLRMLSAKPVLGV